MLLVVLVSAVAVVAVMVVLLVACTVAAAAAADAEVSSVSTTATHTVPEPGKNFRVQNEKNIRNLFPLQPDHREARPAKGRSIQNRPRSETVGPDTTKKP